MVRYGRGLSGTVEKEDRRSKGERETYQLTDGPVGAAPSVLEVACLVETQVQPELGGLTTQCGTEEGDRW